MRIRNNPPATRSYRSYRVNVGALNRNLEKLSSGYRINRSADDAAGLAISEKMQDGALDALDRVRRAVDLVSDVRGTYGAIQNRLEHTINYLGNAQENIQYAESVIRDADMADEMMKYTKNGILVQSAQSMLAQANMQPEGILRLLQ